MSISDKAKALTKSNPNETNEIYNQGFKSGGEHSTPSQETIKLIKSMDEKNDIRFDYIKELLERNDKDHEKLTKTIDDFIKGAEKRYVNFHEFKPIKAIVYGMVGFVLVATLGGVISLVIK